MSILKISHLGHPVLRKKTKDLTLAELKSPLIQKLIDDMVETLHEFDGVGLAAPQVHESKSIVIMEYIEEPGRKSRGDMPLTVLVNPVVTPLSDDKQESWEGCLSIPDIRGKVPRHTKVQVKAWDRNGKEITLKATGFHAVIIQHETDHLKGILFIDRMEDMKSLTFLKELARYGLDEE